MTTSEFLGELAGRIDSLHADALFGDEEATSRLGIRAAPYFLLALATITQAKQFLDVAQMEHARHLYETNA